MFGAGIMNNVMPIYYTAHFQDGAIFLVIILELLLSLNKFSKKGLYWSTWLNIYMVGSDWLADT